MLMRARTSLFQRTLGGFLGSVLVVFLAIAGWTLIASPGDAAVDAAVVAACTLLGLAWVVLGWLFVPSVETYVGPGASRGIPIFWPSSAIPERNAPVLEDLKGKLSGQTDMGIAFAVLGFLLIAVGLVFYAAPPVGALLLLGFVVCTLGVFAYTFVPRVPETSTGPAKSPPNP